MRASMQGREDRTLERVEDEDEWKKAREQREKMSEDGEGGRQT